MRHNKKFNHLSRTSAHRKAMLANMASSLIESKRITTTVAKAKALRSYVEPLITKAKNDTTHSRRTVFRHLQNKDAVSELFREVAAKIADRPGGYTRILRTGTRLGDNAEMCIIELVDYNEAMLGTKEEAAKPKRRRSRRGGSGKKAESSQPAQGISSESAEKAEDDVQIVEDVQPVEETEEEPESSKKTEEPEVEEPKAESGGETKAETPDTEKKADEEAGEDKKKEE